MIACTEDFPHIPSDGPGLPSGRMPRRETDLVGLIRELCWLMSANLPDGVEIRRSLDEDLPSVLAVPEKLACAVSQLLDVSLARLSKNGGQLSVRAAALEETPNIAVTFETHCRDIADPEGVVLPQVFPEGKGEGARLARAGEMARDCGGEVEISGSPEGGLVVRLVLPCIASGTVRSSTRRNGVLVLVQDPFERDRYVHQIEALGARSVILPEPAQARAQLLRWEGMLNSILVAWDLDREQRKRLVREVRQIDRGLAIWIVTPGASPAESEAGIVETEEPVAVGELIRGAGFDMKEGGVT